jgi:hypothetical protein
MEERKCRHCGGHMTQPKPVTEGPKKGQMRIACFKCGHIEYIAADVPQQPRQPRPQ